MALCLPENVRSRETKEKDKRTGPGGDVSAFSVASGTGDPDTRKAVENLNSARQQLVVIAVWDILLSESQTPFH